jgi:hypothetical protein
MNLLHQRATPFGLYRKADGGGKLRKETAMSACGVKSGDTGAVCGVAIVCDPTDDCRQCTCSTRAIPTRSSCRSTAARCRLRRMTMVCCECEMCALVLIVLCWLTPGDLLWRVDVLLPRRACESGVRQVTWCCCVSVRWCETSVTRRIAHVGGSTVAHCSNTCRLPHQGVRDVVCVCV